MGIPKFYRWISERYPCLSEKIREYQIPDFDNLYLDMNGIIHTCSHPNDDDVHLRIPEDMIFREIFRYIDFLFKMIKPRKVFFMAVDGVAPRAKMNQQRGRRFRSAKLASDQEAEALKKGEKLPTEERFDSNCITPGTAFMARLHEQLQYFVKVKVTTDPLWQREGLVVYLSGHDVPGEGEHKIMDFIRHIRSKPDYDAETRHCLYGLDADLIMLGLSSHELHFSLLREEVKFGNFKKKRRPNPFLKNKNEEGPDKNSAIDLSNASLFKEISAVEMSSISGSVPNGEVGSVSGEISYAAAAQSVCSTAGPNTVSEVAGFEASLTVDSKAVKKDAYHPPIPEKTTFLLLHLSLLRDYINEEFKVLKETLKNTVIEYDLEKIIDDWILMSILVGNDFVPNLPHLHINTNALPMLYQVYFEVLPTLGGYLNENGNLMLDRFEVFLRKLSTFDIEHFRATYDDMKYMASKTGKNIVLGDDMMKAFEFDDDVVFEEEPLEKEPEGSSSKLSSELQALINRTEEDLFGTNIEFGNGENKGETAADVFTESDELFDEEDSPQLRLEFAQSKRHYYVSKMDFKDVKTEVEALAKEYIRAIQWVLLYYYKGVSSWCWYYPAHYAPFASDLKDFKDVPITFEKGQPFKPFEQLLGVLPSQSKKLLPECYQWLMTHENSPIYKYYPEKFEQDLNGKKQDWEAVILIPFIDEIELLQAMGPEAAKLTEEENFRNCRGKLLLYSYKEEDSGPIASPGDKFPRLSYSHVHIDEMIDVPYNPDTLPTGVHPSAKQHVVYQGFPTLKSIPFQSYLDDIQVKVFEMTARDVSLVLDLSKDPDSDVQSNTVSECTRELAQKLIGKKVWVNWPHLTPALVCGVSDNRVKYIEMKDEIGMDPEFAPMEHTKVADGLIKRHLMSKGIRLGDVNVIIWAKLMEGRKLRCDKSGKVVLNNLWGSVTQPFAYATTITDEHQVTVFSMAKTKGTFKDLYRKGDKVFLLENKIMGAEAVIADHDENTAKVKVEYIRPVYRNIDGEAENDLLGALETWSYNNYFTTHEAARMCNLDPYTFSKISGCIFVVVEKGNGSPKKKSKGFSKNRQRALNGGPQGPEADDEEEEIYIAQETKKVNVGLDLKFNKKNQKARGYTTKESNDKSAKWRYSLKTVELVRRYVQLFPDFVEFLRKAINDQSKDCYLATEIFSIDPVGRTREIQQWVEGLGLRDSVQRIDFTSEILDDDEIQIVWGHILKSKQQAEPPKKRSRTVPAHLLYKPGLNRGCVQPVPDQDFLVLDRIVCVDPSAGMPLGARGTIVGTQEPQVKNLKETIEESFKATSATILTTLIVMPDPQPDVFDKAAETFLNNDVKVIEKKDDLTSALKSVLGIGSNAVPSSSETKITDNDTKVSPDSEYQPVPKLVKLFPYQVINITDTEVQEYKTEGNPQKLQHRVFCTKPSVLNGMRNQRPIESQRLVHTHQSRNNKAVGQLGPKETPSVPINPFMQLNGTVKSYAQAASKTSKSSQSRNVGMSQQAQLQKTANSETEAQPIKILKRLEKPMPPAAVSSEQVENPIMKLLEEGQRKKVAKKKQSSRKKQATSKTVPQNFNGQLEQNENSRSDQATVPLVPDTPITPDGNPDLLSLIQHNLPKNPERLMQQPPKKPNRNQVRHQTPAAPHLVGANQQAQLFNPQSAAQVGHAKRVPSTAHPVFANHQFPPFPLPFVPPNMVPMANFVPFQLTPQPYGTYVNPSFAPLQLGFVPPLQVHGPSSSVQFKPMQEKKGSSSMVPTQALRQSSSRSGPGKNIVNQVTNVSEVKQVLTMPPFPSSASVNTAPESDNRQEASIEQLLLEATQQKLNNLSIAAGNRATDPPATNRSGQKHPQPNNSTKGTGSGNNRLPERPPKSRIAANFGGGL